MTYKYAKLFLKTLHLSIYVIKHIKLINKVILSYIILMKETNS